LSPVPVPQGVFFGPPLPPFRPGARVSPRSPGFPPRGPLLTLPPRASIPPRGPGPGHPLYFPHCFHGTGGQGQAFRGPGFRSAFMLSGGQASSMLSGGFQEARLPPRLPGVRAFRLSGFQETGGQGPGPGLPALLFFLIKIDAAGCFQQRPIIYVMSPFLIFPNISLWLSIYSLCATVCLCDVCFKYLLLNNYLFTLSLCLFFPSSATTVFKIPLLHKYTHFQDITPRFFSFFRITIQFAA
jgi:hypothetical protein